MPRAPSISLILPVYDNTSSAGEVENALRAKLKELGYQSEDYEVVVYNGKTIGESFASGIGDATKEYLGLYSAYNQIDPKSLETIIPELGKADIIIGYIANPEARPWFRRIYSWANVYLVNAFFGLDIKYYHFPFFRTELSRKVEISSSSHAAMTEAIVWLIKSGARYVQVPIFLKPHDFLSKSGAFEVSNLIKIFRTYLRLFILVRIRGKRLVL